MVIDTQAPVVAPGEELILDRVLPVWDATVTHHLTVDAPAERVWAALQELDLAEVVRTSRGARALIAVRAVPVRIADRVRGRPAQPPPEHVRMVEARPWVVLGEREPRELVVGAIGRFWGPGVEWLEIEAGEFADFDQPAYGKIAWGFAVLPYGLGRSLLVDECRTRVTDPASRRRFLRYWKLVGPGASYVMGRTLTLAKQHAEEEDVASARYRDP
jgi:hypothetical protein